MNQRSWRPLALAVVAVVVMASCGDRKTESASSTANPDSMAAVEKGNTPVIMEGDTANNSMTGPTQAPPDSGDRGAVVPANVTVTKKKE